MNNKAFLENGFTILAVDDDPSLLRSLKRIISSEPYIFRSAGSADEAEALLESERIHLVLLDLKMPGRDGMSLLRDINRLYPDVSVIMLTGHGGVEHAVEAMKLGAVDFLEKPCPPEPLCRRLAVYYSIWQQRSSATAEQKQQFTYSALIGDSSPIQKVKSLIIRMAASDAPLLIQGESGTGKELAARAVHHHSVRRHGPFVAIDCAVLNENMVESELFGHEQGAFTGAGQASVGLIRSADKGTLFFDEIGELPFSMQAKLLRTLQEYEVRPVGSAKSYSVDIRILAATNRNLEQEVANGRFRSDLFYRLSAICLELPPLTERDKDVFLLSDFFLKEFAEGRGLFFSKDVRMIFREYHWPGNVRELQNVIRRIAALCLEENITPEDLPPALSDPDKIQLSSDSSDHSFTAYEQLALENAMEKAGNNRRRAAEILGVSEATLYRKLKQFKYSQK